MFTLKKTIQLPLVISLLISAYIMFKPLYFLPSGLPQLADIIILISIFFTFLIIIKKKYIIELHVKSRNFLIINLVFVFYVFFVNYIWNIILGYNTSLLYTPLWYLYNFFIVFYILFWASENFFSINKIIYLTSGLMINIQVLLLFIGFSNKVGSRETLFFNNPNQLGYHSLLTLALLLFSYSNYRKFTVFFLISILSSLYLSFSSLSKAAILSSVLLVFIFLFLNKKINVKGIIILASIFISVYIIFSMGLFQNNDLFLNVKDRIGSIGQSSDDNLSSRGYDRVLNHSEYLIFGAGEGANDRFESIINGEIHSTFVNIFFSYGIVGGLIFITIIGFLVHGNKINEYYYIMPIFIYSLTHNGVRNGFFWILLSLIVSKKSVRG